MFCFETGCVVHHLVVLTRLCLSYGECCYQLAKVIKDIPYTYFLYYYECNINLNN